MIILIDGSSYLFRAYFALPPLTTSAGQPTGAIVGVINMLRKLLIKYNPENIAVVFDTKGKTFRHNMFADYKANRDTMPDDLALQIKPLHNLIRAMGIKVITKAGVEADDVIGTIATKYNKKYPKEDVLIATSDKDMAQLVNEKIRLINIKGNEINILNEAAVVEKFGLKPNQIIDYLALAGDSSDNIPGITKVGPKTAVKWLLEYETLQGVIDNADKIKGKIGENLRAGLNDLDLYKKLTTINIDVEDIEIENLNIQNVDKAELNSILQELEIKSWQEDNNIDNTKQKRIVVSGEKEILSLLNKINHKQEFCFILVPNQEHYINAKIEKIIISIPGESFEIIDNFDKLKEIFSNKNIIKTCYNLKTVKHLLINIDITINNAFDVLLASYIVDKKYMTNQITVEQLLSAKKDLEQKLDKNTELSNIYFKLDLLLSDVLFSMEQKGVLLDLELLKSQSLDLHKKIEKLKDTAFNLAGEEFNLNSPKQLQEIFYNKLQFPILEKTPKGQASTAEPVLQELALSYELPEVILKYRSMAKLLSTYIDKLPEDVNEKTGRIHTNYHMALTATGRLSSSDPNLQNIPVKTEEGNNIRKAFVAEKGFKILSADYSQIELRIMAHLSDDPRLLQAFENKEDIHTITASEIFNVNQDDVTKTQRRNAKAINFGLIYGMSAFGLSKQLHVTRTEADSYIKSYFEKFPKVKEYMENVRERAHKDGFVETIWGRRIYVPEINSKNMMRVKAAERAAINAPMQGSQADFIKQAMIDIDKYLKQNYPNNYMLMQVHDELIFEIEEDKIDLISEKIRELMMNVVKLKVKLDVDIGIGNNWQEAH